MDELTDREREIAKLAATGMTTRDIARALRLPDAEVEECLLALFRSAKESGAGFRPVGAMIVYSFRAGGTALRLVTEPSDRDRALEWLTAWLRDEQRNFTTVGFPPTRIARAMIGSHNEPPDYGVALEWALEDRIGIATSTAKMWADDLEHGRSGVYAALQADQVIPLGNS